VDHGTAGWPNSALASCCVTSLHASTVAAGADVPGDVELGGAAFDAAPPDPGAPGVDALGELAGGRPAL
jgi:hypothetical protein